MGRRPAAVTQADVARALRAAEQVAPGRMIVEVAPGGTIRIFPAELSPLFTPPQRPTQVAEEEDIIL